MKFTPLDLQQKAFRKVRLGGVDEREVRQFLEMVASEMEEMKRKLDRQDEELRRREARISEFKDREHLLQQTLTTAQRLSDEIKASTKKEADIILSDAELQAEKIIANAQSRRLQLIAEIDELKRVRGSFIQALTAIIEQHKALLEHVKADLQVSEPPPAPPGENVSFLAPPVGKKK
jgi:cell division initiation protein